MFKSMLMFCFIGAALAANTGYNYQVQPQQAAASHHYQQQVQPATHTEKHFYYFNAPQETRVHEHVVKPQISVQPAKKTQQVIFINLPEHKARPRPTQHYQQSASNVVEDKTHIYFLNKEPQHAASNKHHQTVQQPTVTQHHHHKPEVHYIKYHTDAEADQIQQQIIQQYGGNLHDVQHITAPVVHVNRPSSHHREPHYAAATNNVQAVPQAAATTTQYHHQKPEVHHIKYHTPQEANQLQQQIIKQHGGSPDLVQHLTAPVITTGSSKTFDTSATNVHQDYLPPPVKNDEPVAKNYAKNFLPSGVDVVPGSSYLPPVLRR